MKAEQALVAVPEIKTLRVSVDGYKPEMYGVEIYGFDGRPSKPLVLRSDDPIGAAEITAEQLRQIIATAIKTTAEQYAREFAAEHFETMRDWFLNNGATNLVSRAWVAEKLDEHVAELKGSEGRDAAMLL